MENGLPSAKPVLPPITSSPEAASQDDEPADKGEQTQVQPEKNPITVFREASDFVSNPFEYSSATLELLEELKSERRDGGRKAELCAAHVRAGLCELTRATWKSLGFGHAKQWANLGSKQEAAVGNWKNLAQLAAAIADDGDDATVQLMLDGGMVAFALEVLSTNLLHPSSYSKFQPQISRLLLDVVYRVVTRKWGGGLATIRAASNLQATVGKYVSSGDPSVKTSAVMLLAYVLREAELKQMPDSFDMNIKLIVQVLADCLKSKRGDHLSEEYGYAALAIMKGLRRISAGDASKDKVVAYGALPLYAKVLKGAAFTADDQKEACKGLWTLAFTASNRAKIAANADCMEGLRRLAGAAEGSPKVAADCALWVIEREAKHIPAAPSSATDGLAESGDGRKAGGQIMISYHRAIRKQVASVKDRLVELGYTTWMDTEQMTDYTPEAVIKAVDDSSVVLIFYTERYKLSPRRRLEAQYASKKEKRLIPIKMESEYDADGWLALLVGKRMHFDFTKEDGTDAVFNELCSELQRTQGGSHKEKSAIQAKPTTAESDRQQNTPSQRSRVAPDYSAYKANEWREDQVQGWLMDNRLAKYLDQFSRYPGSHIVALRRLMDTAPEFFYNSMKAEYGFDMFDLLTFTNALQSLD